MSLQPTQVEFDDFSGGITDDYLPGPMNRYQRADNFLITRNKKLETRPGSDIFNSTYYQIPAGAQRIQELINFDNNVDLFYLSRTKLYYVNAGWQTLNGPTGNDFWGVSADTNRLAYSHWNHQLYLVNDSFSKPMKVWKDGGGAYHAVTAGLPVMAEAVNYVPATELANSITLANDLRAKLLTHFPRVSIHAASDTAATAVLVAPVATDLPTLLTLTNQLVSAYGLHYKDSVRGKPAYHTFTALGEVESPTLYPVFHKLTFTDAATDLVSASVRLNDVLRCFTGHAMDQNVHAAPVSLGAADVPTAAKVGPLTTGPSFTDNLPALYDLANELKVQINNHLLSGGQVSAGPGTWTSGSAVITGFANTSGVNVGDYVILSRDDVASDDIPFGTRKVTIVNPTSVTLNGTLSASGSGNVYFVAPNEAHGYAEVPAFRVAAANATTPATLATLVDNMRQYFIYHMNEGGAFHMGLFQTARTALSQANQLVDAPLMDLSGYTGDTLGGYNQFEVEGMRQALMELKAKFNLHQKDATAHFVNPVLATYSPYPVVGSDPSNSNYLYAFHYEYTYTVGTTTYLDRGPLLVKAAASCPNPEEYAITISSISALANGGADNYDTANLKIRVARTINNGQDFYYVGELTNGTTTFVDDVSDTELQTKEPIYTAGGVVENDPPPPSKYIHVVDGFGYYGNILDTDGSALPNRVRQSVGSDIDSVPGDFFVDFDEEVAGLNSVRERPLVFCTDSLYRLEGAFDERGQGAIQKIRISETQGCISHRSIVQTDYGVFFASNKGFCWTDGYQVQQITDWETTYGLLTRTALQRSNLQGCYNKYENRIWWTAQQTTGSTEADKAYILHLNQLPFSVSNSMPFTSASGASFFPTSLCVFNKELLRGDRNGYTFRHSSVYANDKKTDTALNPSLWGKETILWNYTGCGNDFGTSNRKWVSRISLRAKNSAYVSAQINANNDDGTQLNALMPVKFRGATIWGDPNVIWGDPNLFWNYAGMVEDERHFPAGSLRAVYKQIQIRNAFVPIENSDTKGLATVDATTNTATLVNALTMDWDLDCVDYFIAFEDDGYVENFLITTRNSNDVITFADPLNHVTVTGNKKWVVRGFPKNERLHLLNYTIHHAYMDGRSIQATTTSPGENV
jgi:hypothetical protein